MKTEDLDQLKKMSLFANFQRSEIEPLLEGAIKCHLKHHEVLFRAGDAAATFSVILQGALKLVKTTAMGDEVIVHFAGPGDPVAALIMGRNKSVYPVTAVALGPTSVFKIPQKTFIDHWSKNPEMLQHINALMFSRMAEAHEDKLMAKNQLTLRIAKQLIHLMDRFGEEGERILPIPITRQEIADSLGASVESVIRVMSDWSHEGIIKTTERHIEILRMDRIVEILKG